MYRKILGGIYRTRLHADVPGIRYFATRSVRRRKRRGMINDPTKQQLFELKMVVDQSHKQLPNSHAMESRVRKVDTIVRSFTKQNLHLPSHVWDDLLEMYALGPDIDKMTEYVGRLEEQGQKLSTRGHVAMLSAYGKLGEFEKMVDIVKEMRSENQIVGTRAYVELFRCLSSLTHSTIDSRRMRKHQVTAMALHKRVQENEGHLLPSAEYYTLLFDAIAFPSIEHLPADRKAFLWDTIEEIVITKRMIPPNSVAAVLHVLAMMEAQNVLISDEVVDETSSNVKLVEPDVFGEGDKAIMTAYLKVLKNKGLLQYTVVNSLFDTKEMPLDAKLFVLNELRSKYSDSFNVDEELCAKVAIQLAENHKSHGKHLMLLHDSMKKDPKLNAKDDMLVHSLFQAAGATNDVEHLEKMYNDLRVEYDDTVKQVMAKDTDAQIIAKLTAQQRNSTLQTTETGELRIQAFPSELIANSMITALLRGNNVDKALDIVFEINSSVPRRVLPIYTYNLVMSKLSNWLEYRYQHDEPMLVHRDYGEEAIRMLVQAQGDMHELSIHPYNSLIRILALTGRYDSAMNVEAHLQHTMCFPDSKTFEGWYLACQVHNQMRDAELVWDRMVHVYDHTPTQGTFEAFITGFLKNDRLLKAITHYDAMKRHRLDVSNVFVSNFAQCLLRVGDTAVTVLDGHDEEVSELKEVLKEVAKLNDEVDLLSRTDRQSKLMTVEPSLLAHFEVLLERAYVLLGKIMPQPDKIKQPQRKKVIHTYEDRPEKRGNTSSFQKPVSIEQQYTNKSVM